MFITKQTLKIFLIQLVVLAGLLSIGIGSKYALDNLESDNKEHLQSLLDKKTEAGHEAYQSLQMVMEENPELIIEMGKAKNERAKNLAISSLFVAIIFLYLSAVVINVITKKT